MEERGRDIFEDTVSGNSKRKSSDPRIRIRHGNFVPSRSVCCC